jgi:Glycosyl transferase family 2
MRQQRMTSERAADLQHQTSSSPPQSILIVLVFRARAAIAKKSIRPFCEVGEKCQQGHATRPRGKRCVAIDRADTRGIFGVAGAALHARSGIIRRAANVHFRSVPALRHDEGFTVLTKCSVLSDEFSESDLRPLREAHGAGQNTSPRSIAPDRVEMAQHLLGRKACSQLGIFRLPESFKLSVVMPVYNEIRTLAKVIERVRATGLPLELVIVDDGSRDGSREYLAELRDAGAANADLKVLFHEQNRGKGGAIKTGFLACTGNVVVIQDADLEYDPSDYWSLLQPIVAGEADVVYGSRFSHIDGPVHHYWHRWGNQLITRLSNWKSGRALTDAETCYKMIRRELVQQIAPGLIERGFGIELELTHKLSRLPGVRFYERPVSYVGRSWAEGKKIGIKDGLWALWCILRY